MPKLKRKSKTPAPAAPSWFRDHWQTVLAVLLALLGGGVLIGPHLPDVLPPIVTPVDPAPFVAPDDKLYVLVLEDRQPEDSHAVDPLITTEITEAGRLVRSKNVDGWRRVDKSGVADELGWAKDAFTAVRKDGQPLPYGAISVKGRGWQGPIDDQFVEKISGYLAP